MFFFFKQKTAYELRISDWSSDVCSSDLSTRSAAKGKRGSGRAFSWSLLFWEGWTAVHTPPSPAAARNGSFRASGYHRRTVTGPRSEEHTSELQSLMRISYAVFCLKKKKTPQITTNHHQQNTLLARECRSKYSSTN